MDILLCGDFETAEHHAWRHCLQAALPEARWLSRAEALATATTVQVAVVANPPPGSLQGLPKLRLIQSLWAGVDRLLQDPTLPPGVPIARMADPHLAAAMAETALWATLALHRGFFGYARQQAQGLWRQQPQRRAADLRVLLLGLGEMGRAAAQRIAAQGYRVSGWALKPRAPSALLQGIDVHSGTDALWALLPHTDIVINLLPLTPATRGLLDARFFAALPRGAALANLARGAHVVDAELLAALDSGQIGHAVLDVFHDEPLPAGHAYWTHPQVTVLPHVAALTDLHSAALQVAHNLRAWRDGRPLANLVQIDRGY